MATPVETVEPSTPPPKKSKSAFKGISKTTNAVLKTTNDLKKNVARKFKGGNAQDEDNIVIARMQYLDGLVDSLPKTVKTFKREGEILKELTDHQKTLLTQTTDLHQQLLKDKTDSDNISPQYVEAFQLAFCQLHTELFSLETSLVESINETSNPLSQISGLASVKEQYKKWDVARQAVDEASKKLENAKKDKNAKEAKIEELETALANAKANFETVDRDTLAAIESTIERIELEYLTKIKTVYVEAYRKYFQQGQQLLKKVSSQLAETEVEEQPTAGENSSQPAMKAVVKSQKRGRFGSKYFKAGALLALAGAVALAGFYFKTRK